MQTLAPGRSIMVVWSSSLAPDIVRHVADLVLAANDVDHYMDMRAVCHSWRLAMADPCRRRRGDVVDDLCRFRPRNWVMLDEEPDDDDGVRLFLNVSTGRFIRRHVPMLRDHILVAASDGLLVLADEMYPHAARVLNPFTGWFLRFAAAIPPRVNQVRAAVAGSEDDPSLVFSYYNAVLCARRTDSHLARVDSSPAALPVLFSRQASMAVYRGHVYIAGKQAWQCTEGLIVKLLGIDSVQQQRYCGAEPVASLSSSEDIKRLGRAFLVVSAGELLLVCHLRRPRAMAVFRVDVERKVLEHLTSIGRRALFLGDRCLSVDAGELPSVDGNCVYMVTGRGKGVWRYDLGDNGSGTMISGFRDRPLSMVQVLLTYCIVLPDAKAQLISIILKNLFASSDSE